MDDISLVLWCGRGACSHCLGAENHLLSRRIVIQGSAYDGSDFFVEDNYIIKCEQKVRD